MLFNCRDSWVARLFMPCWYRLFGYWGWVANGLFCVLIVTASPFSFLPSSFSSTSLYLVTSAVTTTFVLPAECDAAEMRRLDLKGRTMQRVSNSLCFPVFCHSVRCHQVCQVTWTACTSNTRAGHKKQCRLIFTLKLAFAGTMELS